MPESPQPPFSRVAVPGIQAVDGDPVCAAKTPSGPQAWQFTILGEVANFALLRRHLGRGQARLLMAGLAAELEHLVPAATLRVDAAHLIELNFTGSARADVERVLDLIATVFGQPITIDGEMFGIDLVLGAAAWADGDRDDVRLIEEAERARDDARSARQTVIRDVTEGGARIDPIAFAREIDAAIVHDELFLHYQPKLSVRRQAICSVEALIRWRHPVRGLIQPGDFIPLAEEMQIMAGVTLWTIRRVIADQRIMAAHGHDLRVFINVTGSLLADPQFVAEAGALVAASGVPIGFEITETSVIGDPETAIANLHALAAIGIVISIDDYGAGLSSLAYLKQLPARELKIDKLFVRDLTSSNRDPLIVRSTIDLAHALEMDVVAEGVETQSTLALLSVMGCDMVQGFFISRPIELVALIEFLSDQETLTATRDATATADHFATVRKHG